MIEHSSILTLPSAATGFAALSHERRLAVLRLLVRAGPQGLAAGEIARSVGLLPNTLSTHLKALALVGLVTPRRAGRSLLYAADLGAIRALLAFLIDECCDGRPEVCEGLSRAPGASA